MSNKKYEITEESKVIAGATLHRIRALRDVGTDVKAGDIGGWIEKEFNLSHSGDCWIFDDARVSGNAEVFDDARVSGSARVFGNAWVLGNARVFGNAWVLGNALVSGNAEVSGNALVSGNVLVSGNAAINTDDKIIIVGPIGSRNGFTSIFVDTTIGVRVNCGCFSGTLKEFEQAVNKRHGDSKTGREYRALIALAKIRFCEFIHDTK